MRFSFPSAKKHSVELSGDQNGDSLALVFISGRPLMLSSARTQNRSRPSTIAPKTTKRPSGEMRGQLPDVNGGPTVKCVRIVRGAALTSGCRHNAIDIAAAASATPATHRHPRHDCCSTGAPSGALTRTPAVEEPDAVIKESSSSPAVWYRCDGSG